MGDIILTDAATQSLKIIPKDNSSLTEITMTSKFDQITAAAFGDDLHDLIYNENGFPRGTCRAWEVTTELFGAEITIQPAQKDLFGEDAGVQLNSIKFAAHQVRRLKGDEGMRFSFTITVHEIPRDLIDFFDLIKKGTMSLTIAQGTDGSQQNAKITAEQFGLFKQPKSQAAASEDAESLENNGDTDVEHPAEPGGIIVEMPSAAAELSDEALEAFIALKEQSAALAEE